MTQCGIRATVLASGTGLDGENELVRETRSTRGYGTAATGASILHAVVPGERSRVAGGKGSHRIRNIGLSTEWQK
jgi:hypothetical protein